MMLTTKVYPFPAFIARQAIASTSSSPQLDIIYSNDKWRLANKKGAAGRVDTGLAQWVVGGDGVFVFNLGETLHLAKTLLGDDIVVTSFAPPASFPQSSNASTVSFVESSDASTTSGPVSRVAGDPETRGSPLRREVVDGGDIDAADEAAEALAALEVEPPSEVEIDPDPDNVYRADHVPSAGDAAESSRYLRRTPKRHRPQDNFTQHEYNVQMQESSAEYESLVLSTDWSKTPMGPLETWPPAIRTMMSIAFASATQDSIWFGPIDNIHLV